MGIMKVENIRRDLHSHCLEFSLRLAPLYELLSWEWGSMGVPNAKEIEKTLHELVDDLSEETTRVGTGGLWAYYEKPTRVDSGEYGLSFIVDDVRCYDK